MVTQEEMTRERFSEGILLLGGPAMATKSLGINQRAIDRVLTGREPLCASMAVALQIAVADHRVACGKWLTQMP